MRKKLITGAAKTIAFNAAFLTAFLEIGSRIYFHAMYNDDPYFSPEIQEYLAFVHHSRSEGSNALIRHPQAIKPIKDEGQKHMVSAMLADCKDETKCSTILLQGDSWAHGLELNASDLLFGSINKGQTRVISGGTSSFSVSNAAGQLNYFINQKSVVPNSTILFIDQTDLGDELCRYEPYISKDLQNGDPFVTVAQEPPFETIRYNYEAKLAHLNASAWQPRLPIFLAHIWHHFSKSIYARWIRAKFSDLIKSAPSKSIGLYRSFFPPSCIENSSDILSIHEDSKRKAINLFKAQLNSYLETAKASGVNKVFIFTHPHIRHLSNTGYPRKIDIAPIVNQLLQARNSNDGLQVFHYNITPPLKALNTSEDYFDLTDWFSHPTQNGYRKIAKKMQEFINSHGGF